jgi:hypothetical protein
MSRLIRRETNRASIVGDAYAELHRIVSEANRSYFSIENRAKQGFLK